MTISIKDDLEYSRGLRKRSDIDIMANILNEACEGARKTRIMYKCNLSHKQLQIYLNLLQGMGFLVPHRKKSKSVSKSFETTSKGVEFLDTYRNLRALMT